MTCLRAATWAVLLVLIPGSATVFAADEEADYAFFKSRVQPIFIKHRAGHAECVQCHAEKNTQLMLALQPLDPGAKDWTEEQTRLNYKSVSTIVAPGRPTSSQLLMHPLAPEAGGDPFHSGGRQFASQSDPDWVTLSEWVKQKPAAEFKNLKLLKGDEHLFDTMRFFNLSLRADCSFCHVAADLASDRRPTKAIARTMIQKTVELGQAFGKDNVNCYTCHRGDKTPLNTRPLYENLKPTLDLVTNASASR